MPRKKKETPAVTEPGTEQLSEQELQEALDLIATGKPVINKRHIETLNEMARRPGVVSIHIETAGGVIPFYRPKVVLYAIRTWAGENVQAPRSKRVKIGGKRKRIAVVSNGKPGHIPGVEKVKLITETFTGSTRIEDTAYKAGILRISTAKQILDEILGNLQQHKRIDATTAIERLGGVPDTSGNQKADAPKDIPGGVDETLQVHQESQDAIAG